MERIAIFIDGSNLYHQLKEFDSRLTVDYHTFSMNLTGKNRTLLRTYYYVCPPPDADHNSYHDQQKFFSYLQNTPYLQLQFGEVEKRGDGIIEKGLDVRIAVEMVALAYEDTYDTAILVSNDADLAPAVECIKKVGKHVEYAFITQKTVKLVEVCDVVVEIDAKMLGKKKTK